MNWNERAAMALGWKLCECAQCQEHGWDFVWLYPNGEITADGFDPDKNPLQATLLEAEIERRGLREKYIHVLWEVVISKLDTDTQEGASYIYCDLNVKNNSGEDTLWYLITAKPAQRTEAAVLTLEGDDER